MTRTLTAPPETLTALAVPPEDASPAERIQYVASVLGLLSGRILKLGEQAADSGLATDCAEVRAQVPLLDHVKGEIEQALREIERPDLTMEQAILDHLRATARRHGTSFYTSRYAVQVALNKDRRTAVHRGDYAGFYPERHLLFDSTLRDLIARGIIEVEVAHATPHYRLTSQGGRERSS